MITTTIIMTPRPVHSLLPRHVTWNYHSDPRGEWQGLVCMLGYWEKRGNLRQLQPHKAGLKGGDLPPGLLYEFKGFPESSYGSGVVEVECSTNIC